MATGSIQFTSACNTDKAAFRAYSGLYTFNINGIPKDATIVSITFSCASGAFSRYTNDSGTTRNESVNAKYKMFYATSSSKKPSTSGSSPNTLAIDNTSNCYGITDTQTISLTSSNKVPTTTIWTVEDSYESKFTNGSTIYIYFARTGLVTSGTGRTQLQYNTVEGAKGQLICTVNYLTAPSNLRLYNYTPGDTQYYLTWDPAVAAGGEEGEKITYFVFERSTSATLLDWGSSTQIGPFPSPAAGTTYTFGIYAQYSGVRNAKAPQLTHTFSAASTPTLEAPAIQSVKQNSNGTLDYSASWSAATGGSGTIKYVLLCDNYSVNEAFYITGLSATSQVDSYGKHTFQVIAIDSAGTQENSSSRNVYFIRRPTNLNITGYSAGGSSFTLSWEGDANAVGYQIQYKLASSSSWTTISGLKTATSYTGPVPGNGAYQYRVYAISSGNDNVIYSEVYSYTFSAAPVTPTLGTPSINSITPVSGSTSYTISWSAAQGASSYQVKYRLSGSSNWTQATSTTGTSYMGSVPSFGNYEFKIVASNETNTNDSAIVSVSFVQVTEPIRPKITSIKHTPGAATFEIAWSEAQIPGFSGTITYWLWDYTSGSYLFSNVTGNQAIVEVPQYDVKSELYLCAYYNSTSLWANETNEYTFESAQSKPSITFEPNFNYSVLQGTSITISWDNFTVSGTDYSNFYYIFYYRKVTNGIAGNQVRYASSIDNERTISQTEFLNELGAYEGQQYNFGVLAFVSGLTNTSSGSSLSSGIKWSSDIFTYSNAANISLTKPGTPSITQHSTQATFSISWTASIGTGGSGPVTYDIMDAMNGTVIVSNLTATTRSGLSIPLYGKYEYKIRARYSGQEQVSDIVKCTFEVPSIQDFGEIYITPTEGPSVKVSWKPATLKYTTGTINYKLWCKKNSTGSDSNWIEFGDIGDKTEQTVDETWLSTYGASGDKFYFQVDVHVTNLSHIANDQTKLTDGTSFAEPFTFITGNTIGYYHNNAWRECTVYYYGWNSTTQRYEWIECIPYYYNGGWQEINTKIE